MQPRLIQQLANPRCDEFITLGYNQLQKYLRHCTVFWHKWPVHDLVLVIPPTPLIKVASNTRPYSKLGGTTLNGREEGGQYYISQTCDQERFAARKVIFSWECLNIFATGRSKMPWESSCLSATSLLKCLHIKYLSNDIAYQIPHFSELWISWYSITFDPVKNFLLFCPFYLTG